MVDEGTSIASFSVLSEIATGSPQSEHRKYFTRYTTQTDGKERLAEAITNLAQTKAAKVLLDLGAGDGRLTRLVAPIFDKVIAVEWNEKYRDALQLLPKTEVFIESMQDFSFQGDFDMALMSYSLSGVPLDKRTQFFEKLFRQCSPNGCVLYATYADGCEWDQFSSLVSEKLGRERSGGTGIHEAELRKLNYTVNVVENIRTLIWGQSLDDLGDVLSFFFLDKVKDYQQRFVEFRPHLDRLSFEMPDGRRGIAVTECLVEVTP